MLPRSTLLVCLFSTAATAQVVPGDVAVSRFSTDTFTVIGAGGTAVNHVTTGFGGGLSQAILFDRTVADSYLIGGVGFLGRATLIGGVANWTLLTNTVGVANHLAWHDNGFVVFTDSGTGQVHLLDPVSGFVVDLSTGAQPWGTSLYSCAWDPATGDVVVGTSGALYRLAAGTVTGTLLAGSLGGTVSGVAFDPVTGDVIATVLTVNRLIRVTAAGVVSDVAPAGSLPGPNGLDVDLSGDFVTGGGVGQIHRIPRAGGSPVQIGNAPGPINGLSVAASGGYAVPFGPSCNGAGGLVSLTASAPIQVGATVVTTSSNHAPASPGLLVVGLSRTSHVGVPLPALLDPLLGTSNCYANVSLDVTIAGATGSGAPADLVFPITLAPVFGGVQFFVQHVCLEPVPGFMSWSNGLTIRVP